MKKYQLIDIDMILSESNTLNEIEEEKERLVEKMIDANENFTALNIFKRIDLGEENEFDKVVLLKPNGSLPVVTHHEYDSDITIDKDECWFGIVG